MRMLAIFLMATVASAADVRPPAAGDVRDVTDVREAALPARSKDAQDLRALIGAPVIPDAATTVSAAAAIVPKAVDAVTTRPVVVRDYRILPDGAVNLQTRTVIVAEPTTRAATGKMLAPGVWFDPVGGQFWRAKTEAELAAEHEAARAARAKIMADRKKRQAARAAETRQ